MIVTRWLPWEDGGVLELAYPLLPEGLLLELHLVHLEGMTAAYWLSRTGSILKACLVGIA
jgi:hypothetical protein